MADNANERDRRITGHSGPCTRRASRWLPGECSDRSELADLPRRDRLHLVVVYRDERARRAFCRRQR